MLCASAFLPLHTAQEAGSIRLGVVQGDVELPGTQTFAIEGKIASNNAAQTLSLAENGGEVDLVVWGERLRWSRRSGRHRKDIQSQKLLLHLEYP